MQEPPGEMTLKRGGGGGKGSGEEAILPGGPRDRRPVINP